MLVLRRCAQRFGRVPYAGFLQDDQFRTPSLCLQSSKEFPYELTRLITGYLWAAMPGQYAQISYGRKSVDAVKSPKVSDRSPKRSVSTFTLPPNGILERLTLLPSF